MTYLDFFLAFDNFVSFLENLPGLGFIIIVLLIFFSFRNYSFHHHFIAITLYFLSKDLSYAFWNSYIFVIVLLSVPLVRQFFITNSIIFIIKKLGLLPKISETEKTVLTSGTVWVDGELFSGRPNFKWIFSQKYPKLSKNEESFLNNEVEEICRMCSDYKVQTTKDLPPEVWQYLKDKKFFGIIIPREYGGLGFSAYAHSCVIEKLASRSVTLAITAMVPNSLGPAELLMHYGTQKQRDYYLPRLADGREIPCFALTEPTAGSDATSIISEGTLFRDMHGDIKVRITWNKRYITLGAYATLIGVAFKLRDPGKIISDQEELGITCALVPHDAAGVRQGRRHDPLATPFINSPLNGDLVVVGLDAIIGGESGIGKGWKMLMECLSAGRGISLPSTSCGGSKLVARVTSAYTSIRQQFGTPICKFEGVEEVLARIASRSYISEAMRVFTAGSVDSGAKPAVISAIAKYHATEMFRKNINDGMDLLGGSAIIRGPRNLLANPYFSTPISITVEGANIMTRSLIHFGQGSIMCHPYAYKEVVALEEGDVKSFDKAFFAHIKHLLNNLAKSIIYSLSRGFLHIASKDGGIGRHEAKIAWASATFALLADVAMAKFGGNLKRKERINGRFGDVLSGMYMAVCIIKKFDEDGRKKSDHAVFDYAMKEILCDIQKAFDGLYQNLFGGSKNIIMKFLSPSFWIMFPFATWARFNVLSFAPNDHLISAVAKDMVQNEKFRDSLTSGIFIPHNTEDSLGRLENCLNLLEETKPIVAKIKAAIKNKTLPKNSVENLVEEALQKSVISSQEAASLRKSFDAVLDAVQVDEYTLEDYKKL